MRRGARTLFVALLGWLMLANAPNSLNRAPHGRPDSAAAAANALNDIAVTHQAEAEEARRSPISRACPAGQDDRNSDLCAQWKAADAASSAAWWARLAGLLTVVSLIGVVIATHQTVAANRIARDTAKRQLRAYFSIDRAYLQDFAIGSVPCAVVDVKNEGQTPGHAVCIVSILGWHTDPPEEWFDISARQGKSRGTLAPGALFHTYSRLAAQWTAQQQALFDAGNIKVYLFGEVTYKDAFDHKRVVIFRMYHGRECPDGKFLDCERGNDAN